MQSQTKDEMFILPEKNHQILQKTKTRKQPQINNIFS